MRKMSFQYTHNSAQSSLVAAVMGSSCLKKNKDGTFNKTKVICTLCGKTLSFPRSNKYQLNAMHALVGEGSQSGMRQTTLTEQRRPLIKCACDKLTSTVAKWIAKSCRPIILLRTRGSPKFCEHQSTAKTHNNDKNPRAV